MECGRDFFFFFFFLRGVKAKGCEVLKDWLARGWSVVEES